MGLSITTKSLSRLVRFLFFAVIAFTPHIEVSFASCWHVSVKAAPGSPHLTIQDVIDIASTGDSILVGPGQYYGAGNYDISFNGKDLHLIGVAGPDSTIIDCQGLGRGFSFSSGESSESLIEGLTIINGGFGRLVGGGIYCSNSSPTLSNLVISGCAASNGGGIYLSSSSSFIQSCTVEGNSGDSRGGGIYIIDSNPEFKDVDISTNWASFAGGGVFCSGISDVRIDSCIVSTNTVSWLGGGIHLASGTAHIVHTSILSNTANDGAGIWTISPDSLVVVDSRISMNTADRWGGGVRLEGGSEVRFTGVLIHANSGNSYDAGGFSLSGSDVNPLIEHCSIVGNIGGAGAGLTLSFDASVSLHSSIVAFNTPGFGLESGSSSNLDIQCCDFYSNLAGCFSPTSGDHIGYFGNIQEDPQFCIQLNDSFTVATSSPCLPENNECSILMGAYGVGCSLTESGSAPPPVSVQLLANHPNPFNPSTIIPFVLDSSAIVSLSVHDVTGRLIDTLLREQELQAGRWEHPWDGMDDDGNAMPSGVYFYRLKTPDGSLARPMLLVK